MGMHAKTRVLILVSSIFCSLVLLSGCGDFRDGADQGTIADVSSGITESGREGILGADRDVFYSIPEESTAEGYELCAADMYNSATVELLYADPRTFAYKVSLYSIVTGETSDAFSGWLATPDDYYLITDNFKVINAYPFIIEDVSADEWYVFAKDLSSVQVIETSSLNAGGTEYIESNNSIYYQDYINSSLCRYDLDTGAVTDAFTDTLPYQTLWLDGFLEDANLAVFSGTRISDSAYVNVLVDLDTGKARYETTADVDFYEADNAVYVFRETGNSLVIGLLDEVNSEFDSCCEIMLDNSYLSFYIDQQEDMLFISTSVDSQTCRFACYNLADQTLTYENSFDISGYLAQSGSNDSEEDFISLSFTGSRSFSADTNGILISVRSMNGIEDILVWNLNKSEDMDEPLSSLQSWSDYVCTVPAPKADYVSNDDYAAALSEKYGIGILQGDDAVIPFDNYEAQVMEDDGTIYRALAVMEKTLALYPEDFFRQFKDESLSGISFYLVGKISPVGSNAIEDPGGFACISNGIQMIILNVNYTSVMQQNICHEVSHAIDRRLENLGYEEDTTYLDENVWASFNPRGFEYYYSYLDKNGTGYEMSGSDEYTSYSSSFWSEGDKNTVYFVDVYSKTYPTEDRARIMEMILCEGDTPEYMESVHLQRKMEYYFAAIRAGWDTTGWPDITSWEQALILQ